MKYIESLSDLELWRHAFKQKLLYLEILLHTEVHKLWGIWGTSKYKLIFKIFALFKHS